tara:strand:- start:1075 stop:1827 length:753 start_codon:yes stop_codon:yes gene_type:complete
VEIFNYIISFINSLNIEISWLFFLFFCFISILIFLKLFGYIGLYIYSVVAVIAGNIQVLKTVDFFYSPEPVALGTILFSSTFLCTDILSEHYGSKKARLNVLISFSGFLLMTIFMLFTIGFKESNGAFNLQVQNSLNTIFTPMLSFFIASMIAYLSSQYFDVWLFSFLKKIFRDKYLWLRNNISTFTSSLIDNIIFSILAWIIFNPNPLALYTVIFTYILGTYFLRIFIAIIDTPFIYLAKVFLPRNYNE